MIYLIKAKDRYHIDKKIKELITQYKIDEFDIHRYDANQKGFNYDELVDDLRTIPFFSQYKLVILSNPMFILNKRDNDKEDIEDGHVKNLIEYCLNPSFETIFIMYSIDYNFKTSKDYKNITKNAEVIDYTKNSNFFIDDARSLINQAQLKMSNECFNLLVKNSNNEYSLLLSNIEKLCLYNDEINLDTINALTDSYIEENIFEFTNALFDKNISLSFKIIDDFYKNNLSTFYLIAILASQLRFYNQVSYYHDEHYSIKDIVSLTNSKKEYRINLALNTLSKYRNINMLEMLNKLAKLEQKLKSSTSIDERLQFELFILDLVKGYDYAIN